MDDHQSRRDLGRRRGHPLRGRRAGTPVHQWRRHITIRRTTRPSHSIDTRLAKILASLENDNLITRTRSDADRRVVIVEATPDAAALWDQVLQRISTEVVTRTTRNLSDGDIATLSKLLTNLNP